jgi:hypothetical protein
LFRKRDLYLQMSYMNDIEEVGNQQFIRQSQLLNLESVRGYLGFRFDDVVQYKVKLNYKPIPFSQVEVALSNTLIRPLYDYTFVKKDGPEERYFNHFNVTEMSLGMRYAFGEKFFRLGDKKIFSSHKYPIVYFRASKGFDDFWNGDFDYLKFDLRVSNKFDLKSFGQSEISVLGGVIFGEVPYSLLYNSRGSSTNGNWIMIDNHFQTMGLYEFASDQFFSLFFNHNFGNRFFRHKYSRPEFVAVSNLGYGSMRNPSNHQGISFKTMEKGFFESGLMVNNLIRLNYIDIAYIGLGAGVFYRYGSYQQPNQIDNWAARININFSF